MSKKTDEAFMNLLMKMEQLTTKETPYLRANGYPKPNETTHDRWTDCSKTEYWVHRWKTECRNGCAIHAPSVHAMNSFPQFMRDDLSFLIERRCPHGVGHPDPDSLAYFVKRGILGMSAHGCDGCCEGAYNATVL